MSLILLFIAFQYIISKKMILKSVSDEEFFKHFIFKDHVDIAELWTDEEAPDRLICKISKDKVVMEERPGKDLEFKEAYMKDDQKEKVLYLEPDDLVELSENDAIEPLSGSREIIIK